MEREGVRVPVVVRAVGGDLRLRGRAGGRLIVDGEGVDVEHLGDGQPYVVQAGGDCRIAVPDDVAVSVQRVGGDAKLTEIGGELSIQQVGGDLAVRNTGAVRVQTVGGDMRLKHAEGDVTVETVGGDATIREVDGDVHVSTVGADLYVRNVEGSCLVDNVGADLVVSIEFKPGEEYSFGAGNEILCRVQPDTNATFTVPAGTDVAAEIEVQASEDDGLDQEIVVGDGSTQVTITHAETLRLVGEDEDYAVSFGAQIEEEMEARLWNLEEKLNQQLEGLDERIQERTAKFASQAERWAEKAQRKAMDAAERMRRQTERDARHKRKREFRGRAPGFFGPDAPPPRPPRPSEPVSEEERLMILKMVQDGKITIEEAERLLSALG